jgi:hypothetical protein
MFGLRASGLILIHKSSNQDQGLEFKAGSQTQFKLATFWTIKKIGFLSQAILVYGETL